MISGNIARRIAARYLFSKKSHSVINLISAITIVAIAVPTAAMIILFSVHNGFEEFIARLWKSFDTQLVIEPLKGKYFHRDSISLAGIEGIDKISYYIKDKVLLKYKERQTIAVVRGVDEYYGEMTDISKIVIQGSSDVRDGALMGVGLSYQLGMKVNLSDPFTMIAPSAGSYDLFNPTSFYNQVQVPFIGIFSLDAQRDSEMLLVSLNVAQELFGRENYVTSIAVSGGDGLKEMLQKRVGVGYRVKDIIEQNEAEYRLVRGEKVAIYLIIVLVMIVASMTLIGSILMLVIEKRDNSQSLRMMGVTGVDMRKIFIYLGLLLSSIGTATGLIIGLGVSLAQQWWGFVSINGASMLLDSYPIRVVGSDVVVVALTVMFITFIISYGSCRLSIKKD